MVWAPQQTATLPIRPGAKVTGGGRHVPSCERLCHKQSDSSTTNAPDSIPINEPRMENKVMRQEDMPEAGPQVLFSGMRFHGADHVEALR